MTAAPPRAAPPLPLANLHNAAVHHGVQPLDVGLDGRLLLQQVVKLLIHCQTKESPTVTALCANRDASSQRNEGAKLNKLKLQSLSGAFKALGNMPQLTCPGSPSLPVNAFNPGHPSLLVIPPSPCHSPESCFLRHFPLFGLLGS